MANVLLTNKTRESRTYNTGDKSVTVSHPVEATTPDGKSGVRVSRRAVSGSIIIPPGKSVLAPSIILKQRPVQRDLASGLLGVVKQEADSEHTPKAAPPPQAAEESASSDASPKRKRKRTE